LDRTGRNHQALLYRRREADVALEHCRIIVQKPSGGGKLDEDDGIVQFALKIVAAVILCLAEVYDRLADHVLFGQAERRIHSRAFARISVVGA
jgi:hypothetical protein